MATVTVRTADGQLLEGPEENLAQLQQYTPGAQVLSAEEATAAKRTATIRAEEGGLSGTAKQFIASAVEGGTMLPVLQGVERAYGRIMGGEAGEAEAIERIKIREQENAVAALAGQAVGFGTGAVLSGGLSAEAGLAARGARFATTLPRATMGFGARRAAAAEARVAQEGLKRSIAGGVARGAAEGAALGAGQVVKEAVLGEDITGELVTERLIGGALIGAGGGLVFEGLGAAAVKAAESVGAGGIGAALGAGIGGTVGGLPGAAVGGYVGQRFGSTIGKYAAAGERAALAEAAERRAVAESAAKGDVRRMGDLTAEEIQQTLGRAEQEAAAEAAPRAAGSLDEAEAEVQRQQANKLESQRRDNYEFAASQKELVDREAARFRSTDSETAALARRTLAEAKGTRDEIANSFAEFRNGLIAKAIRGFEAAKVAITGEGKADTMLRYANAMAQDDSAALARLARNGLRDRLVEFANEVEQQTAGVQGAERIFGNQTKLLREAAAEIDTLTEDSATSLAKIHRVADNAKREFDRVISKGPSGAASTNERDVFNYFRSSNGADNVRRALEDPQLFGEQIAATQHVFNKAWRNGIQPLRNVQKSLLREGLEHTEIDPYMLEKVVDPAKALPFMRNIGAPESAYNVEVMSKWIDSQIELQQAALRFAAPTERQAASIGESIKALETMRTDLGRARTASANMEAAKIVSEDAHALLQRGVAENLGGVGRVLTTMLDLERRATMERTLSQLVGDADKRIAEAAAAFVRGGEKPGKVVAEIAKGAARKAGDADKPAPQIKPKEAVAKELATTATKDTRAKMAEDALRQIATVTAVAGTPQALEAFAFQGTQPMQFTTDPRLATTVANASARAMAFLYAKRPPTFESDTLQPNLVSRQLSDGQLAQWRAYATTAAQPLSVLDDLQRGTVRREQVETLRALYPAMYSSIQAKVMDQLHDSRAQISYAQRVLLFQMFGATTDPSLRPASIAAVQASFQPAQAAPSGAPRATPGRVRGSFAADVRTGSETLAAQSKVQ
jgi:hypothetical protein